MRWKREAKRLARKLEHREASNVDLVIKVNDEVLYTYKLKAYRLDLEAWDDVFTAQGVDAKLTIDIPVEITVTQDVTDECNGVGRCPAGSFCLRDVPCLDRLPSNRE